MPALGSDEHAAGQIENLTSTKAGESRARAFKLRPYQLEMLEESMRRNIIVAVRNSRLRTDREAKSM